MGGFMDGRRASVQGTKSASQRSSRKRPLDVRSRRQSERLRQLVPTCEIIEARDRRLELQADGAGGAVALLADDDLGFAKDLVHLAAPFFVFGRSWPRLFIGQVVFLAEYKQDDVGILFDRSRFTQIRELRALVFSVLHLSRQLRKRDNRDVEFLCQRLEAGRDFGDLLHAAFQRAPRRALQQLNVVDNEEVEPFLPLETPRPRGKLGHGQSAGLVDEEGEMLQLDRDIFDFFKVALGDAAAPDGTGRNTTLLGDDAGGELLGRHFQRKEANDSTVGG